ncbi:MAG: hypothetical protein JM58_17755 [Peptococcaceae bacterium BICA1-8]|nr:MAG: hypothetical protein JM58_17755 [Peptococcaceae bacterium BICA1-8]
MAQEFFSEILRELRELNGKLTSIEDLLVKHEKNHRKVVQQMAYYLKEHQQIADFVINDITKRNEKLIRELQKQYVKLTAVLNPNLVDASRGTELFSIVNNLAKVKDYPIIMAENSLIPTQPNDAAYYRVGFLTDLITTDYKSFDEGYSTFVNTAQNLRVVSTSTEDSADGTGVRTVLVGGLDSNNNRYFEVINLNGTTPVTTTNQFTQLDIINSTSAGTTGVAVGTISVTNSGGTITFGAIAARENAWRSGRVFTDQNATGYIFAWTIGSYNAAVRAQLDVNHIAGYPEATLVRCGAFVNNETRTITFPIPIKIPKSSLVTVKGIAKQEINEVTTSFQLYTSTE